MKRKYASLLAASWLLLTPTAFADGLGSSNWSHSYIADHWGGDAQSWDHQSGASSDKGGSTDNGGLSGLVQLLKSFGSGQWTSAGQDQNNGQQGDHQSGHDDQHQNDQNHDGEHQNGQHSVGDDQHQDHSVGGSVYGVSGDVYGDHNGWVNALSHVKNPHALAVLQAILSGLNPSTVSKSVYDTVSKTVYGNTDGQSVAGQVYSGGTGEESASDDQEALKIMEQDTQDNKADLSNAFAKLADRLLQHGDLLTSRQALEDAISANPTNNTSFQKLAQVLNQTDPTAINTYVNGKQPAFDVQPFIQNDRTLVPIRAISESLGAQVDWNDSTQTATITRNGHTIQLTIGDSQAMVDGQPVTLDAAAQVKDNRTFVPVRFLSEAFGANVQWIPVGQIVDITLQQ